MKQHPLGGTAGSLWVNHPFNASQKGFVKEKKKISW